MSKIDLYDINLKNISLEHQSFEYTLDKHYFQLLENPEIEDGQINVKLKVKKQSELYHFVFHLNGYAQVLCNRCLDVMKQPIEYVETLKLKIGNQYNDEEEIVIVSDNNPIFNIAWFLYESIMLSIPLSHTHEKGKCNSKIIEKLNNHITGVKLEKNRENNEIDPRWEKLKEIIKND